MKQGERLEENLPLPAVMKQGKRSEGNLPPPGVIEQGYRKRDSQELYFVKTFFLKFPLAMY